MKWLKLCHLVIGICFVFENMNICCLKTCLDLVTDCYCTDQGTGTQPKREEVKRAIEHQTSYQPNTPVVRKEAENWTSTNQISQSRGFGASSKMSHFCNPCLKWKGIVKWVFQLWFCSFMEVVRKLWTGKPWNCSIRRSDGKGKKCSRFSPFILMNHPFAASFLF